MSADQNLDQHMATYRGFIKMFQWGATLVVLVIIVLAFITL